MVTRAHTVAFLGVEARPVEVQCALTPGMHAFNLVGLPDKAVSESRERVRASLTAIGLALPPQRITVNLSPADLPKAGSHYDLPIALALMGALDLVPAEELERHVALGELSLDGRIRAVQGALPAALAAAAQERGLICPEGSGAEAAWVGAAEVLAPASLIDLVNHFKGRKALTPPAPGPVAARRSVADLIDVKGQEAARRALEVAAAGNHHILMVGEPGSGKSMLASRLTGIMPPLSPEEALEVSTIYSLAAQPGDGTIFKERPYRAPHHSASMPAMIGGGIQAKPGEVVVSRANAHVRYPARFLLVAAMNPCRCGYLTDPSRACSRAPRCGADYVARLSGPLVDRFDIRIEVPPVTPDTLSLPPHGENSAKIAHRVAEARGAQAGRMNGSRLTNGELEGEILDRVATPDAPGQEVLRAAAEKLKLTARGYHRVLRLARTLADLDGSDAVRKVHVAEAVGYRRALS